jgi:hypothetical protein
MPLAYCASKTSAVPEYMLAYAFWYAVISRVNNTVAPELTRPENTASTKAAMA